MAQKIYFESKFGWSELIATLALVISLLSAWYSREQIQLSMPSITVEEGQFKYKFLKSSDAKAPPQMLILMPITIINSGGRDATLVKLVEAKVGLLGDSEEDEQFIQPVNRLYKNKLVSGDDLQWDFSFIKGEVNEYQINEIFCKSGNRSKKFPLGLNKQIKSGQSESFVIAICLSSSSTVPLFESDFTLMFSAIFSNKFKHTFIYGLKHKSQNANLPSFEQLRNGDSFDTDGRPLRANPLE